jgi:two-component system sensor histidine kinase AlgZ
MRMEQLRMGDRLTLELVVDELPMDLLLPPLTLQPLLENAVYHGIEPLPEGGTVRVFGTLENGSSQDSSQVTAQIVISNPVPAESVSLREMGHNMAQANIRARLEAHFEHKASLQTEEDEHEYRVRIRLPYAGDAS